LNNNYIGIQETPKDYQTSSLKIGINGSDFMFMTFDDNIEILENVPAEKINVSLWYCRKDLYKAD
jgi:hypothetical protein